MKQPQTIFRFDDQETVIYPGDVQVGLESLYQFASSMPPPFAVATNVSGAEFLKGQPLGRGDADIGFVLANNSSLNRQAVGLCAETSAPGFAATVQLLGQFCLLDWTEITGTEKLLPRTNYYLSNVPGMLSNLVPQVPLWIQRIGYSISPNILNLTVDLPVSSIVRGPSASTWNYRTTVTVAGYPGNGRLGWNNATQITATNLLISHITGDGQDIDSFFYLLTIGKRMVIQDADVAANYQTWDVTGAPVNFNPGLPTSYWSIPVTFVNSGGTGTTNFPNNHPIFVALF